MWTNHFHKRAGLTAMSLFRQSKLTNSTVFGQIPTATFAKYDRNKPHLNVGTIGKYLSTAGDTLLASSCFKNSKN